ncbi:MAG: tetratricopeptide repeat protein [Verrucomicrobiota bacterium]|nr:tetratricopeptide repeat protein [Verrucomicrobiota bacterium]
MRTTQNPTDRIGRLLAAVCLVAALAGCTPPSQKALENGSRLLAAGKTAEALVQLQDARKRIEGHPNLKTNLVVVGKLYNQLGLAHQTLSRLAIDDDAKSDHRTKAGIFYGKTIEQNPPFAIQQYAYQNRAWLYLEAVEWEKAAEDLGSLLHITENQGSTNNVFQFWLEKGTAEFGAGRIAEAEKSFSKIPNDARAQNNLGNIAWKQKRNAVAADHFEQAITLDEKNTTALRNLGAVRQELKQYAHALKAYRSYLALVPDADTEFRNIVESLEEYLKPDPEPDPIPEPVVQVEPEPEPEPEPAVVESTPEDPEPEPVVIVEPPTEEPEPEPVAPEPEVVTVVEPEPLPVPEAKPEEAVTSAEPSEPEPAPVITQVEPAKPAKDWKQRLNPKNWFGDDDEETTAKPSEPAPETEFGQAETSTEPKSGKDWKQRVNPVSWFKSDDEETTAKPKKTKSQISWRSNTPVPTTPLPSRKPLASASTNAVKVASVLPSAVAFPRYKYLNPALPNSGDRQVAKTYFDDGDGAQKREEWQRAKAAYLEAAKADPAWFDARFELGQAAYYTGDTDLALQSFEHALAIEPNDGPARFNFAKSLVQGNYYAAAAHELETFLQLNPDNAQAHFEAGRLYSQELSDVTRAAVHYKRVIGLKPGHPQAVTIRYWLIRNKTN